MSNQNGQVLPPDPSKMPSSFDDDPEFLEEGWVNKLGRRLREEPLIPMGCAAACFALYQASKSIRAGDHDRTNRMFRARIYAQGFTLVAILAGSFYYQDERMQRKEVEKKMADFKAKEKRDKWLRELEIRDREDREWRERHLNMEKLAQKAVDEAQGARKEIEEVKDEIVKANSVVEEVERRGWRKGTWLLRDALRQRFRER
ncbi:MAG: hypothetical protein Q9160_009286 [Pyrenula sp. 1 TL-2023]